MARLLLLLALIAAPGCLVVTVNPAHEGKSLVWEPLLVGEWHSGDDNVSLSIEAGEWQSYDVEYHHPIEQGRLTAYLTSIGQDRYLDAMPGRGEDRGSFVLPLHVVLKLNLDKDRLELTPLSYDFFFDRLRKKAPVAGLEVLLDQKENALIVSPTAALRAWIRRQPAGTSVFGPAAVFIRKSGG